MDREWGQMALEGNQGIVSRKGADGYMGPNITKVHSQVSFITVENGAPYLSSVLRRCQASPPGHWADFSSDL